MTLTNAAFEEIGVDKWHRACAHVEKTITNMKKNDHYMGEHAERIVINLADDTTDSDDDSRTETASMGSTTDTASEVE